MNRNGILIIFIFVSLILHALLIFITMPVAENVLKPAQTVSASLTRKADMRSEPEAAVESAAESGDEAEVIPKSEQMIGEPVVKDLAVKDEVVSRQDSELPPEPDPAKSPEVQPEAQLESSDTAGVPSAVDARAPTGPSFNPFSDLIKRINSLKDSTYPLRAKKRGYQGTVIVELNLDREGLLISASIFQKCRHSILNNAALELIEKVFEQPYPHNTGKDVILRIPVKYKLL